MLKILVSVIKLLEDDSFTFVSVCDSGDLNCVEPAGMVGSGSWLITGINGCKASVLYTASLIMSQRSSSFLFPRWLVTDVALVLSSRFSGVIV